MVLLALGSVLAGGTLIHRSPTVGAQFATRRTGTGGADDGLAAVQGGGQQVDRRFAAGARAAHRLAVHRQPDQGFLLLDGIGGVAGEPGADGVVQRVAA